MGDVRFLGIALATAPGRVMTPRPASEQLVDVARERLAGRRARVVDVGTGSGAVAVAIAAALPDVHVWATDTSACAVALARANARRHGLWDRVVVRRGDLLGPVPGPVELIVANLPYLPAADAAAYPDLTTEPAGAVFAAGDGLGPYRRLLAAARARLTDDSALAIQLHRRVHVALRSELDALAVLLAAHPYMAASVRTEVAA
jgi:release factor glutamine methyltransferase